MSWPSQSSPSVSPFFLRRRSSNCLRLLSAKALNTLSSSGTIIPLCNQLVACQAVVAHNSELLRQADKDSTARPELWREHADAAAIAEFVDLIEQVDGVEPDCERLVFRRELEFARNADVHRGVRGHMIDIGEARAQTAAVKHRRAEQRSVPAVARPCGSGHELHVIGIMVVREEIGVFSRIEEILARYRVDGSSDVIG